MDWERAIEWNRVALTRVLAMLVAMAGLANTQTAIASRQSGSAQIVTDCPLPTSDCRLFLPRHLHRAVLRLLRPAEAAARRLVIAAARVMVVAPVPPPLAPPLKGEGDSEALALGAFAREPDATPSFPSPLRGGVRGGGKTGSTHRPGMARSGGAGDAAPRPGFPLFDPLPRHRPYRLRQTSVPRISMPGFTRPFPLPPPLSDHDPVDATRLGLRLAALGCVLDDLPRQARRFARWQARLAQGRDERRGTPAAGKPRTMRIWPLRPGRPPGSDRRSRDEVQDILKNTQGLALWALRPADTS